jgi:hypothetical protein
LSLCTVQCHYEPVTDILTYISMGKTFGSAGRRKRRTAALKSQGSRGRFVKTGPLANVVLPDSTDDSELAPPHQDVDGDRDSREEEREDEFDVDSDEVPWRAGWFKASDVAKDATVEDGDSAPDSAKREEWSCEVYKEIVAKTAPEADDKECKRKRTNARQKKSDQKKKKKKVAEAAKNTNKMTTFFQPQVLTMSL